MSDFNKVLEPGDFQNGLVNTVVEVPEGSILKTEWDRESASFRLIGLSHRSLPNP